MSPVRYKHITFTKHHLSTITKIFHKILAALSTLWSFIRHKTLETKSKDPTAIQLSRTWSCIGASAFLNTSLSRISINNRYLGLNGQSQMSEQKEVIAFPIVLKKSHRFSRDHIVTVVINTSSHHLFYYDPKGDTILDNRDAIVLDNGERKTLFQITQDLINTYSITSIDENTLKHQYDAHNCGVFALNLLHSLEEKQYQLPTDPTKLRKKLLSK